MTDVRRYLAALFTVAALAGPATAASEVNIYSTREPKLMEPLFKAFTAETGIKTNIIFASSGLIERMAAEGRNSPADVLLVNESGLLFQAVEAGVTQGWHRYVGDQGDVIGVDRFGASAPGPVVMREYGFTVEHVCRRAMALVKSKEA